MHKVRERPATGTEVEALRRGAIPAANQAALAVAFERAASSKVELLQSAEMLNGDALGAELGLSRATIDNRRVAGKLLALELGSKRGYRFPRWQRELVLDPTAREAFESTLKELATIGSWSRYRFFVRPSPQLEGRTPIEALVVGHAGLVLRAAQSWAAAEQGGG